MRFEVCDVARARRVSIIKKVRKYLNLKHINKYTSKEKKKKTKRMKTWIETKFNI